MLMRRFWACVGCVWSACFQMLRQYLIATCWSELRLEPETSSFSPFLLQLRDPVSHRYSCLGFWQNQGKPALSPVISCDGLFSDVDPSSLRGVQTSWKACWPAEYLLSPRFLYLLQVGKVEAEAAVESLLDHGTGQELVSFQVLWPKICFSCFPYFVTSPFGQACSGFFLGLSSSANLMSIADADVNVGWRVYSLLRKRRYRTNWWKRFIFYGG